MQSSVFVPNKKNLKKRSPLSITGIVRREVQSALVSQIERKYLGYFGNSIAVDWTGGVNSLCDINQGLGDTERTGDHIVLKRLLFRYQCVAADTSNNVRLLLFTWFPSSAPNTGLVLSSIGSAISPYGFPNHDQRANFRIHKDVMIGLSTVSDYQREGIIDLKFSSPVQYVAGSGSTATGKLYLLYISDSGVVAHPTLTFVSKVEFTDA